MKRSIYLKTLEIKEALAEVEKALVREGYLKKEKIESKNGKNRILSSPVYAKYSSPPFHCAAMDGYCVKAESTFVARPDTPVFLDKNQCQAVNTGNALPAQYDAVVMIEQVVEKDEGILLDNPVFPYEHVRRIGEDIVATELLFPQHKELKAWDISALLSGGIWEIEVYEQPRICIIPSGDEILDFTTKPEPKAGEVIESNSQLIKGLLEEIGCVCHRVPPVKDNIESLKQALDKALKENYHSIIFCAGSSAGSKDYTKTVIEQKGKVLVHGIAAMPGKPSLLGICEEKLVIGAPGYPVSTLVCIEELAIPLLSWLMYKKTPAKEMIDVALTRNTPSKIGTEEFLRLAIGKVEDKYVATPLSRGAGNITTVCRSQGVAQIPLQVEGVKAGEILPVRLTTHRDFLEKTLVCVGSHDNTLDILHDELMKQGYAFTSSHLGSTGGITALKNKACHFAGMHLFDPEKQDFNFPFLESLLPNYDFTAINIALRHQGLIVAKENPLNIKSIEDLQRVRFINRQKGSGTRILFDHKLKEHSISASSINGYQKEEFTHLAVAVQVLANTVDCGMGIQAAAIALNLDFIPLALERYDIVFPTSYLEDPRIQKVLEIINSPLFKERIIALGGYEIPLTGQTMKKGLYLG